MFSSDENAIYGFVSTDMNLWPQSVKQDEIDLNLLIGDLATIEILQRKGIGCEQTSFGITLNQSKALMLATRFAYCCSCGRFTDVQHDALKHTLVDMGTYLSPTFFMEYYSKALLFASSEPEYMLGQQVW